MKKLIKILLSSFVAVIMFFSYVTINHSQNSGSTDIKLSFVGMKATAQTLPGEQGGGQTNCLSFGYKNWDAVNPLLASGYSCLCVEKQRVKNSCQ